jgi:hypothetical protein
MTRTKEKGLHVFNPHELKLAKEEVERAEEAKEGEAEKEAGEKAGTQSPTVIKKEDSDKEPR